MEAKILIYVEEKAFDFFQWSCLCLIVCPGGLFLMARELTSYSLDTACVTLLVKMDV